MTRSISDIVITGKWKIFPVRSNRIDACLAALASSDANAVAVPEADEFAGNSLTFLKAFPNLQGLAIPYPEKYDLDVIESLQHLRWLTLGKERRSFNFSQFEFLEELSANWKSSDVLPKAEGPLEDLSLWGYAPKSRDLVSLPAYQKLKLLNLVSGSIERLDGIERLGALREAEFDYLRQLRSVAAIGGCGIEILHIEASTKIEDFGSLASCPKLRLFRYANCGSLPSLSVLDNFKALEDFRFVNTNILDGDLTPLLKLKSTAFLNKRHYSHTDKQIAIAIGDESFFRIENSLRGL
jgi:protein phosphatase 1 regulatory subunit 7